MRYRSPLSIIYAERVLRFSIPVQLCKYQIKVLDSLLCLVSKATEETAYGGTSYHSHQIATNKATSIGYVFDDCGIA